MTEIKGRSHSRTYLSTAREYDLSRKKILWGNNFSTNVKHIANMSGKGDERPKSLPQQQLQKLESSCSFCNNPFNAALHSKATLPQPFCFGDCMCMGMPPQSSAANRCMRRGKLLTVHCLSKAQSFPL